MAKKTEPKKVSADHVEFEMQTASINPKNGRKVMGEPIIVVAPKDSLDKHAEDALSGVFRYA